MGWGWGFSSASGTVSEGSSIRKVENHDTGVSEGSCQLTPRAPASHWSFRPLLYFHSSLVLSTHCSLYPTCTHLGTSSQPTLRSEEHGEHLFLICALILMCLAVTVVLVLMLGKGPISDPCSETNSQWETEAPVLSNEESMVCLIGVWSGLVQP